MLSENSTDVIALRKLGTIVMDGTVKALTTNKASAYMWFCNNMREYTAFEQSFKTEFIAFESSLTRFRPHVPGAWTLLDVNELARRMINDLVGLEACASELIRLKSDVIRQHRASKVDDVAGKHKAFCEQRRKIAPWILNGATRRVYILLKDIGAIMLCIVWTLSGALLLS